MPALPLGGIALATTLLFAPTAGGAPAAASDRGLDPAAPRDVAAPADVEVPEPSAAPQRTPRRGRAATEGSDDPEEIDPLADLGDDEDLDWRTSPQGIQARRRIGGGVALTLVGALLGIGALVLASTDPCRRGAGNSCQTGARNRGAWVMGVPGAAVLAGGIVLLTLGVLKRQRITAGASASRRSAGLVISGRF